MQMWVYWDHVILFMRPAWQVTSRRWVGFVTTPFALIWYVTPNLSIINGTTLVIVPHLMSKPEQDPFHA